MTIPLNGFDREEHDGDLHSKNVKLVGSTATIYAVVNTGAAGVGQSIVTVANPVSIAGNVTLDPGSKTQIAGNVTLSDSKSFIGLVSIGGGILNTVTAVTDITNPVGIKGNLTLSDSKSYIGLVTVGGGTMAVTQSGTWDEVGINDSGNSITIDGNVGVLGNVTLSDSKTFIGLTTVVQASSVRSIAGNVTLSDSKTFIGLSTTVTGAGDRFIGLVTVVQSSAARTITGNITLSDSKTFIGLVTADIAHAWSNPNSFIGLVTAVVSSTARTITGNLTISDSKGFIGLATTVTGAGDRFIGLVTAVTQNAGTTKTLIPIPVAMSTSSQATVAVPATNLSIYVTSLLLSSNATVRVSIKSGVTYLTGNASIGITLNPGGGWVETGAPDAPIYRSTPSASINIEKFDMTGTIASLAGKLVYYTE